MKYIFSIFLFFIFQNYSFAKDSNPSSSGNLFDQIVAVIEDEPVTLSDAKSPRNIGNADINEMPYEKLVKNAVFFKILEMEADKKGLKVRDEQLDSYVEEVKKENGVDHETFLKLLKREGLTLEEYKKKIKTEIIRSQMVPPDLKTGVVVDESEVDSIVSKDKDYFIGKGKIHLHQVRIPYNEAEYRTKAKEFADKILAYLEKGFAWDKAGQQFYVDVGEVSLADLRPELVGELNKLKVGEVSKILDYDNTLYIVKASRRNTGSGHEVDNAKRQEVKNKLYEERLLTKLHSYVEEELVKNYHIEYIE